MFSFSIVYFFYKNEDKIEVEKSNKID